MPYIGTSPSNGVRRKHTYTATASQTSFSGAGAEGATLSYNDSNFVDVYQNGVKLSEADYTSTSGTAIVLAQGASVSDIVEVVVYDVFSVADTVSKADGGTFDSGVTVSGDLDVDSKTLFVDASENKVGVGGETSLLGTLHVRSSDASITSVSSNTDDLIIENNGNTGISIASSTSGTGSISFIDSGDTNIGRVQYDHSANSLSFRANDITAMTIDSIGAVTKPLQPAFLAQPSSQQANLSLDPSPTIAFGTEIFDQNGDFSSNTFTAPITGRYQLQVMVRADNVDTAANFCRIVIVTSNRNYIAGMIDPARLTGDPGEWNFNGIVLADMDANDTAHITWSQSAGSAQTDIETDTFFSGYLVC